jgi:nicotinamidase-related amidase
MPNRSIERTCSIAAKPGPTTIDPAMTAALAVDMRNDFAAEGGMFERAGIDISITRAAIGPTARALAAVRQAGIGVTSRSGFKRRIQTHRYGEDGKPTAPATDWIPEFPERGKVWASEPPNLGWENMGLNGTLGVSVSPELPVVLDFSLSFAASVFS